MPERHLLDILKNAEHWTRYTRHFVPPSGADPKISQALRRYVFTVFGYGCNLGPTQTARHAPDIVTQQALRRINAQHIDAGKLEAARSRFDQRVCSIFLAQALGFRAGGDRGWNACHAA